MSPKKAVTAVTLVTESFLPASEATRQYVLDTNVLLHDPTALFRFQEHDIYIPLVVLEELDKHKKGVADLARNARQVTRTLDELLHHGSMAEGFDLASQSHGAATGRLYFRDAADLGDATVSAGLLQEKPDNQILACAMALIKQGFTAVLVTKDINLRVKAMACDIPAQDYRSDRVLSDEDVLPTGFMEIEEDFWEQYQAGETAGFFRRKDRQCARVELRLPINSFLVEKLARSKVRLWRVESNDDGVSVLVSLAHQSPVSGTPLLTARNPEQELAMSLLHDPEVDFVAMLGVAGTGKTLLALAAGLEQVKNGKYKEVMITRATVPMGDEIGFLPGTEAEKMDAWLGGTLRDGFSALKLDDEKNPLRAKVEVASMSFMRGRSFQEKYIIVDEAQNLTTQQMRALLTRAGNGSKVIVTGNLSQIDTPYLDEGSSGLAWAVKHLQDWKHGGHIILPKGERSRLATYVEEVSGRSDN